MNQNRTRKTGAAVAAVCLLTPALAFGWASSVPTRSLDLKQINQSGCTNGQTIVYNTTTNYWTCSSGTGTPSDNSVTSAKIVDGTIAAADMGPNSVVATGAGAELSLSGCSSGQALVSSGAAWVCTTVPTLGSGSITTNHLADDTVAMVDIADTLTADAAFALVFDTAGETFNVQILDNSATSFVLENQSSGDNYLTIDTSIGADAIVLGHTGAGTTLVLSSADWTIGATGNMAGIGTITNNGLITASGGLTLTGATSINDSGAGNTVVGGGGTGTVDVCAGAQANILNLGTGAGGTTTTIGNAAIGTVAIDGGGVWSVDAAGAAAFASVGITTLTLANSETVTGAVEDEILFTSNTGAAQTVTLNSADTDANADMILRAGGTGAVTIGAATNTSFTVTTDGTGTAEVVLPLQSIAGAEVLNDTLDFAQFEDTLDVDASTTLNASAAATFIIDGLGDSETVDNDTAWTFTLPVTGADAGNHALGLRVDGATAYLGLQATGDGAGGITAASSVVAATTALTLTDTANDGDYDAFTIRVDDAAANAFRVWDATNTYINVDTNAATPVVELGNALDDPDVTHLGTGNFTINGTALLYGAVTTIGDASTDSLNLTAAVQGVSPIFLDGASDDVNGMTLTLNADPGAAYTIHVPATSTYALALSTLTTNDFDVANSVWLESNAIAFEGALDAFETRIQANPTVGDQPWTIPDAAAAVSRTFASLEAAQTFTGALTLDGATVLNGSLTMTDADADIFLIGQNAATPDTVTIAGDVSLNDDQWFVTADGLADFASLNDTPIGNTTPTTAAFTATTITGDITANNAAVNTILFGDASATITLTGSSITVNEDNYDINPDGTVSFVSASLTGAVGLTLSNLETITNGVDGTVQIALNDAGSPTLLLCDSATPATGATFDVCGAAPITIGSGDVTAINLTTAGSGTATVVAPTGAIDGTEVLDDTLTFADIGQVTLPAADPAMAINDVYFGADAIVFEGAVAAGEATVEGAIVFAPTVGDQTWTVPDAAGAATRTFAGLEIAQTFTADQTLNAGVANQDSLILDANGSASAAAFTGTLTMADITVGNKTWALPDLDGTVMVSGTTAGGDLTGTYVNPTITADVVDFLNIDYSIAADAAFDAGECYFSAAANGFRCEGSVADTDEVLISVAEPTGAGDVTINFVSYAAGASVNVVTTGDTGTVTAGMVVDASRNINLPLGSFHDVTASAEIDWTSAGDAAPDYALSNSVLVIQYDAAGPLDSNYIGTTLVTPADYASTPRIKVIVRKATNNTANETVDCEASVNDQAISATGPTALAAGTAVQTVEVTPTGDGSRWVNQVAGNVVSIICNLGLSGDDVVNILAIQYSYTATQ